MIKQYLEELEPRYLLPMWQDYCMNNNYDDLIYDMEEFDEIFQNDEPSYIANRIFYGDFNPNDEYFTFNGYGNLVSFDSFDILEHISLTDLVVYIIDNDEDFGDSDLREILDNEDDK